MAVGFAAGHLKDLIKLPSKTPGTEYFGEVRKTIAKVALQHSLNGFSDEKDEKQTAAYQKRGGDRLLQQDRRRPQPQHQGARETQQVDR